MSERKMSINWPMGVACGLIFGGGCFLIWREDTFWALAMLVVGLAVGSLWPRRQPVATPGTE